MTIIQSISFNMEDKIDSNVALTERDLEVDEENEVEDVENQTPGLMEVELQGIDGKPVKVKDLLGNHLTLFLLLRHFGW